ncbi:MAG: adenosylcobinamide kinase/adenosylcobinamide-phosphate guanylyltransferase [Anaerofustis stercorihominis]|nr:adenosylcobinamide kinase/adenosylcobinamide-phosphate guanylyltransferase [Anaerofustis stercorihominis]
MLIFVLGGVKCGKSMLSQCASKHLHEKRGGNLYYVATMVPHDDEDRKRVDRHLKDRENWGFETVEEPCYFPQIRDRFTKDDVLLIDSMTAYVQNIMFGDDDIVNGIKMDDIARHVIELSEVSGDVVVVSDYIFSDAIIYETLTERYREWLGRVHIDIARAADVVIECAYSNPKIIKCEAELDLDSIFAHFKTLDSHLSYADI